MPVLSTVLLSTKGEVRKANLTLTSESKLNIDILQKYFKKKDQPDCVCQYEHDNKIIFIFGYKKGKKGTENKTELPDPYSETPIYGDALVIVALSHVWESPIPFTVEQWNSFYQMDKEDVSNEEDEEEDDEDDEVLSQEDEKSVKDDFEDEEESLIEKDEEVEDVEEEPEINVVVKRRRAPVYTKVDTSSLKEEIPIDSEPETNTLRMKCLEWFSFLETNFPKEEIRSLEKGIFQSTYQMAQKQYIPRNWKSQPFIEVYRQNARSVLSNLHPQSPVKNPRLYMRVLEGEFKLADIPFMTSYEMFPENWFTLKDKLIQREQKILEGNKSRATDQFKCRRCNKRECTYYELQTRSADEPMTIFITCLNCGKEWRQGG
jgi:DNA-directed RNA polymerase subunit M/transcription elongation factor TFIIS